MVAAGNARKISRRFSVSEDRACEPIDAARAFDVPVVGIVRVAVGQNVRRRRSESK
jgi:hypothetical protein